MKKVVIVDMQLQINVSLKNCRYAAFPSSFGLAIADIKIIT
jgi:hypothetical protein